MEVAIIFLAFTTLGLGVFGLVMENKYLDERKALADLRAELEHAERDEALLKEAKRFTLSTVEKSIEMNVQQYECLKEHNLL